jgi:integrase
MAYRDRTLPAKKLTHRTVETVDPEGDRIMLPDALVPGLQYRATRKGQGTFLLKHKVDGKHRRITLGKFPKMGVSEARKAAMSVKGGDVPEPTLTPTASDELSDHTFAGVVEQYLQAYAEPRQKTAHETRRVLETYAVPELGRMRIEDIGKGDITRLLHRVAAKNGGTQSNRLYAHLRSVLGWAFDADLIQSIPMPRKKPALGRKRHRALKDDELSKIIKAVDAFGWPHGLFYRTLILTGARLREVAQMRWSDLDLGENPVWTISAADYKTGEGQRFPLSSAAAATLRDASAITGDGKHVFTTFHRGDLPIGGFGKPKRQINDMSGVTDWVNHDLRRTMRTWMGRQRDINVAVAERCLGHKRTGIEGVYNHADLEDQMREAFEAWGQHVTGLTGPDKQSANVVAMR